MRVWRIALAVSLAALATLLPEDESVRAGLALFVLIGVLWLTEAMSLTFTALLVPLLGVALGLADLGGALAGFAHPVIFLFLGGFALAAALRQHGIDRWLADRLLALAKGRAMAAALMLALATSLLSMWISNTATTAMMLPVALGLSAPLAERFPRYRVFVLLALAWAANIGGIATLVGSPPNALAAAALGWGFNDWLRIGVPIWLLLLPTALLALFLTVKPEANLPRVDISRELPFPRHAGALVTLAIFFVTVALWIGGKPVSAWLEIEKDFDAWVALLAMLSLGVTGALRWHDIEQHTNWGVLLLFGGGITLSALMQASGTSAWLAQRLAETMPAHQPWLVYLTVAVFVVFLTELVSNTASAALLIPLLMPVAEALNASPVVTAALIGTAASCAFMLPVATPPNALVYGTGAVPQSAMIRAGLWLNLIAALLLGLFLPRLI